MVIELAKMKEKSEIPWQKDQGDASITDIHCSKNGLSDNCDGG